MQDTLKLFGKNFFGSVVILAASFAAFYFLGFHVPTLTHSIGITISVSVLVSFLLTADNKARQHVTSAPTTFWSGVVDLLTNRQPLLFFLAIIASIAVAATYYLFTSIVTVQYSGEAGVIFRLPGQTVYYLPIDPYAGWINTGIQLEKGERFTVELSGRVSPGYLQGLDTLLDDLKKVREWQKAGKVGPRPTPSEHLQWPFTGPAGYELDWYVGSTMIPVFINEPSYKDHQPGYKYDDSLTVKGYPHNTVVGIILSDDEKPPRTAQYDSEKQVNKPGYDSDKEEDKHLLLILSSKEYPIECHAQRSGRLWVVINDSDEYRWDNVGFFFMKLTRYSLIRF